VTQHPLRRVEADGTRVYSNYYRYRPMEAKDRKNQVHKPSDPRAVRFNAKWFLPLEVLSDDARTMPATRPDEDAYDHMPRPCRCDVCSRGPAIVGRWQRKWQTDNGLRPRF
jgi:hypothetical protein